MANDGLKTPLRWGRDGQLCTPDKRGHREDGNVSQSHVTQGQPPRGLGRYRGRSGRRVDQVSGARGCAIRAVQARPAHGEDRTAGARRHPDGTGRADVPEGKKLHHGRPQGRLHLRRHRRQSGRHQDQSPGAGRARQGRRHPRPARRLRALCDQRLHQRTENADAEPCGGRQPHPAHAQSVFAARLGDLVASLSSDRALRRDRAEVQARLLHHRGFRLRLRADGRLPGGVCQRRRLRRQQIVAAAGDAGLHALHRPDRRLRCGLPGLCRLQPAALHEAICRRRPQIPGGDR